MREIWRSRDAVRCLSAVALALAGCGAGDTGGALVSVGLEIESVVERDRTPSDFTLENGWSVHLEEASVGLGPIYLRAPRRGMFSLQRWLLPRALAHAGHAQTLTEGQVLGEFLGETSYDALADTPLALGEAAVESGRLDRVSVVLAPPRGSDETRGHAAFVRGSAERDGVRVTFECGLDIEQDADELPENLEARRRVDEIRLEHAPRLDAGDRLVLRVHPWRWFERVDFSVLEA